MDSNILYDLNNTPYNERETFNNAILLLSMVKSEYYYIIGFSRPENRIEIGFDFEDDLYGRISDSVTMEFSGDFCAIKASARLVNIVFEGKTEIPFTHNESFTIDGGCVCYERLFAMNNVIPMSMDKLNLIILSVKRDIEDFYNQGFDYIVNESSKK